MIKERKLRERREKRGFVTMRVSMIFTMLFGIALALSLMLLVNFLGNRYINNKYLSDEKKTERYEIYKNELQEYVTNNNLTSDDTAAIADWAEQHKYLYLLIFNGEELLFESGQYIGPENNPEMGENKENDDDSAQNSGTSDDADKTPGEDNVTPPGDTESGDDNPDTPSDGGDGGASDGDGGVTDGTGDGSDTDSSDDKTDDKTNDKTEDKTNDKNNDKTNDKTNDKNNSYTSSVVIVRSPTREELLAYAEANGSYPVYTNDNSVLLASMADYTEYFYYEVINILSVAVAVITFIIIMLLHFGSIARRITKLGKEVNIIADGDLDHKIVPKGTDEIARLSSDVEYMRISILDVISKERDAREANQELITAMSHDIRTPLTVLLAYLDIMKMNAEDETMNNYIAASKKTALRLKQMSDDMFNYFLVYGSGAEIELQECDAGTLVDQMLAEHILIMREQGYDIVYNMEGTSEDILDGIVLITDPPQMMRIIENIFSNITKYADREKPVTVNISVDTDEMTIKVDNFVDKNPNNAKKNGIGHKTCMKLASAMDMRFSAEENDGVFTCYLAVPIIPQIEYADEEVDEGQGFGEWMRSTFGKLKTKISSIFKKK